MNVIFCSYRDWAYPVKISVEKHPRVTGFEWATSNEQLRKHLVDAKNPIDLILFCGWSTPLNEAQTRWIERRKISMVSEHPACSDRYSPGTPIQNQILDGVTRTKHRIVKVGYPELVDRQWSHEVEMDLSGNMDDILAQMQSTSKVLFNRFLDDYPKITWLMWEKFEESKQVPRRTPEMSKLNVDLGSMTTKQLYDKIRSLEDPYPNAFIEDEHGAIYFKKVLYKSKQ